MLNLEKEVDQNAVCNPGNTDNSQIGIAIVSEF